MATLSAYITNLGKYNEGELVGEWIKFPIDEDSLEKVFKRIGIGEEDEFGQPYEEYFFTDYECDVEGFDTSSLGEYESIEDLNKIGEILEEVDDDEAFGAALEFGMDFEEAARACSNGDVVCIDQDSSANMDESIGYYYVDLFGGVSRLDEETKERYIDYDALGRDVRIEYYADDDDEPETAAEYWCGNENATDEEIGEEVVSQLGYDVTLEPYFDYEGFGQDIRYEGSFIRTDNGIFEIRQ